jgi:catechol 2,3-dioxygenase
LPAATPHTVEEDLDVRKHLDGNGVELYADRPRDQWPEDMYTAPLDLHALLGEAA